MWPETLVLPFYIWRQKSKPWIFYHFFLGMFMLFWGYPLQTEISDIWNETLITLEPHCLETQSWQSQSVKTVSDLGLYWKVTAWSFAPEIWVKWRSVYPFHNGDVICIRHIHRVAPVTHVIQRWWRYCWRCTLYCASWLCSNESWQFRLSNGMQFHH